LRDERELRRVSPDQEVLDLLGPQIRQDLIARGLRRSDAPVLEPEVIAEK